MLVVYCIDVNKAKTTPLTNGVLKHINQYKDPHVRKISKLSWSYVFKLAKENFKIDFKKETILFNKQNKPHLQSNKIHFSISHSLNLIAIAFSNKPVGVDIEKMVPLKISNLIAKRILNTKEYQTYLRNKNKSDFLTRTWTQKEAYIKMIGSSILDIKKLKSINTKDIETIQILDNLNNQYYLSFTKHK